MKIARWMLCIIIALSAVIIGCGEDQPPEFVAMSFDEWWDILYINGKAFNPFGNHKHSLVFYQTGLFRNNFEFTNYEGYAGDPEAIMKERISYTTRGSYTTQGNILTITRASTAWDVEVSLETDAAWQEQIEGMTPEKLESAFAAEIKKGLQLVETLYTWRVDGGLLTLSSPQQRIVLARQSSLAELVGAPSFLW